MIRVSNDGLEWNGSRAMTAYLGTGLDDNDIRRHSRTRVGLF